MWFTKWFQRREADEGLAQQLAVENGLHDEVMQAVAEGRYELVDTGRRTSDGRMIYQPRMVVPPDFNQNSPV